jgi:hypothetical protein
MNGWREILAQRFLCLSIYELAEKCFGLPHPNPPQWRGLWSSDCYFIALLVLQIFN